MKLIALSILIMLLLSGCYAAVDKNYPQICVNLCKNARINLSNGPCLANPINNSDWVCDVAHNPRQRIDNLPQNQCSAFREGRAHHFVEVDEHCRIIRIV